MTKRTFKSGWKFYGRISLLLFAVLPIGCSKSPDASDNAAADSNNGSISGVSQKAKYYGADWERSRTDLEW